MSDQPPSKPRHMAVPDRPAIPCRYLEDDCYRPDCTTARCMREEEAQREARSEQEAARRAWNASAREWLEDTGIPGLVDPLATHEPVPAHVMEWWKKLRR
jgi:hypothetical protein